ncbi:spermidine synthase [Pseudooceanicola algae]|uniref:Polyamine aminopropyltransferase n=1 Tax=Pseudooceanicola algae TaxID=1537215 RepID=A0A418SFS1_9RHOB|nr:spermidine synthase [Pseudooceanicola algae]QPM90797.1 Polyamine aminopropyltransferase [Pseudooceanicola algae]
MIPWEELASAQAPEGDTLRLFRRGEEFSIRLQDGNELMNSRLGGSEIALATLSFARLGTRPAPRVLIGGLGMGFTLRAAQEVAPVDARLIVSEIVPELIGWASAHMRPVFGDCLLDSRVEVRAGDVVAEIANAKPAYDAILLDVDNGPDGLTRDGNDALYGEEGLAAAHRALTPRGVLAIWSAHPDPAFTKRLARANFDVKVESVRAGRSKRGSRHTVWTAVRKGR